MGCCVSKTASAVVAPVGNSSSNYVNATGSSQQFSNQNDKRKTEKPDLSLNDVKSKKENEKSVIFSIDRQLSNIDDDLAESTAELQPFPDPKTVPILLVTPPTANLFVKIEDTFWEKKKQLIPNYKVILPLDEHVRKVSISLWLYMKSFYNYLYTT